ncbi:transglutaminase TgpA family protein [Alkaliphilus oremlandii]|nr:transglutaminaseTgpA domain-containing protein [Alkaliphilus oremlandii]
MNQELRMKLHRTYDMIYLLLPCTLTYLFGTVLEVGISNGNQFLYTLLIALGVKILTVFPIIFAIALLLFVFGSLINSYYFNSFKENIEKIGAFISNVMDHVNGREEILKENRIILWMILALLFCILTYLFIFKIKKSFFLMGLYYPFFIYYWYIYIDEAYKMMVIFTFLWILFFSLKGYDREKLKLRYQPWLKTAMTYSLLAILAGSILPSEGRLLYWPWLEDKVYEHVPALYSLRIDETNVRSEVGDGDLFSLKQTGFHPDGGRLGGPVKQNNHVVMEVKAPYSTYLRGRVTETYENNRWETGSWNKNRAWMSKHIPKEIERDTVEMVITYSNLSSKTLFATYLPLSIQELDGKTIFADENNQLTVPSSIQKGKSYRVTSILPDTRFGIEVERNLEMAYYLQLPESIPDRVYRLSKSITVGKSTAYEKVLAISDFLWKNYKYSLDVSYVPEDKDFVDYFLFEEKKGYCTYFATAAAVLSRMEGVPTRYIEGYRMPSDARNGVYTVRQKNAHAWIEVYIAGRGWITVDPTPPLWINYSENDNTSEAVEENSFSDEVEQALVGSAPQDEENLLPDTVDGNELEKREDKTLQDRGIFKWTKTSFLVLLFFATALWFLFKFCMSHRRRQKHAQLMEGLSPNKSSVYLYHDILTILEKLGFGRMKDETPYEYAERIAYKIYDQEMDFRQLTEIYLRAKYSQETITMAENDLFKRYFVYVENKLKVQLGKWKYIHHKYFS